MIHVKLPPAKGGIYRFKENETRSRSLTSQELARIEIEQNPTTNYLLLEVITLWNTPMTALGLKEMLDHPERLVFGRMSKTFGRMGNLETAIRADHTLLALKKAGIVLEDEDPDFYLITANRV